MSGVVPPTIDKPKTVIGVGMRELVILGVGLMLGLLIVVSSLGLILKVAIAALTVGLAALLALGRAPTTGKTFEEHFMEYCAFMGAGDFCSAGRVLSRKSEEKLSSLSTAHQKLKRCSRRKPLRGWLRSNPYRLAGVGSSVSLASHSCWRYWHGCGVEAWKSC